MIIAGPPDELGVRRGVRSKAVVSSLDFAPTILEWAGVKDASPGVGSYSGSSLLPLLGREEPLQSWRNTAFGSHNFHSLYAYYPMRSFVNGRYRLVNNLLFNASYAILEDVFETETWQNIRNSARAGKPSGWIYNYDAYMHRAEFELFDLESDPKQRRNLALEPDYEHTLQDMKAKLLSWRKETQDPWLRCSLSETSGECSGSDMPQHMPGVAGSSDIFL